MDYYLDEYLAGLDRADQAAEDAPVDASLGGPEIVEDECVWFSEDDLI